MRIKLYHLATIFIVSIVLITGVNAQPAINIPMYKIENDHYVVPIKKDQIVSFKVSENASLNKEWSFKIDESYVSLKEQMLPTGHESRAPGGASNTREFLLEPKKTGITTLIANVTSLGPTRSVTYELIID